MANRNEYFREYNKANMVRLSLNLSKVNDRDIIESIERELPGNKQASIKSLIREGMKNRGLG